MRFEENSELNTTALRLVISDEFSPPAVGRKLTDPGLVENISPWRFCAHSCVQMIHRTTPGISVPDFKTIDIVLNPKGYRFSWMLPALGLIARAGFELRLIWPLDLPLVRDDPRLAFSAICGEQMALQIGTESDLSVLSQFAANPEVESSIQIVKRRPSIIDIIELIDKGYHVSTYIKPHSMSGNGVFGRHVFIFGYSHRGLICHEPGPPSSSSHENPWDEFILGWHEALAVGGYLVASRPY